MRRTKTLIAAVLLGACAQQSYDRSAELAPGDKVPGAPHGLEYVDSSDKYASFHYFCRQGRHDVIARHGMAYFGHQSRIELDCVENPGAVTLRASRAAGDRVALEYKVEAAP